ncbi:MULTISPECIES: glycosyltransferase [unclassified Microcoleus]|uniref:glycosyltransferase n=1 Tax=unclassified Microcoleus TaxID=2642155 RepID=UPI002FD5C6F4
MRKPIFSIIIPTYNRINDLFVCLNSLTKLDYPKSNFEVIVVDDGNDRADRAIFCFKSLNINLIKSGNVGPASARNKGARAAKGIYLGFIDDDCTVEPEWLVKIEEHLKWFPNYLIGGCTVNGLVDNVYSEASQLIINWLYEHYNKNTPQFVTSNNFAVSKARFMQIGGFNENFPIPGGEDRHFCKKWLNYGYKIIYEPEAIVTHWHELDIEKFCQQQFNYGRGAFIFKKILKNGNNFEAKSFYFKLMLYPLRAAHNRKISITILFIFSQVAILAGFLHQKCHALQPTTSEAADPPNQTTQNTIDNPDQSPQKTK